MVMIAGGLLAAGTVGGAYISAKGAKDAAETQANAAREMSEQQRKAALEAAGIKEGAINDYTKQAQVGLDQVRGINYNAITDAADTQITGIQQRSDALTNAAQDAEREYELALASGTTAQQAATKAARDAKVAAAQAASEEYQRAVSVANTGIKNQFDKSAAAFQPYMNAGLGANDAISAGMRAGGDFNRSFTNADFVKDPGYDFRMKQGMAGVENSAAARGGLLSGNALKALNEYGQGFASNEFDKAYSRFNTDMSTRFQRLSSLADRGMSATGSVANLGANAANSMGANTISGGAYSAQSMRDIGGANADAETTLGNISKSFYNDLGTSRAGALLSYGNIAGDRVAQITNTNLSKINSMAKNESDYASGTAGLTANGTLAIGNAKADGLTGATTAMTNGIGAAANATSAGQAANGQIWGGAVNGLVNNLSTMYMLNNLKGVKP